MKIPSLFRAALFLLAPAIALGIFGAGSAVAAGVAGTTNLSLAQSRAVDDMVQGVVRACAQNPQLASNNEAIRMMTQWATTPEICACQGQSLRDALTPDVLALSRDDQRDFMLKIAVTKAAECGVPIFKAKFSAGCDDFFAAVFKDMPVEKITSVLKSRGYTDLDAYIGATCSCMRPVLQNMSTKEWVDGSLAGFNAYLERRRTGNPSLPAPKNAFDRVKDTCTVPPANKGEKPSEASNFKQSSKRTEPGDANAQGALGNMYYFGNSVLNGQKLAAHVAFSPRLPKVPERWSIHTRSLGST
ncbi:hypothetical protein IV454_22995 [Massilia antarctica]|uniref:Uncharacterized protein n=1 Tax=Massilia antarctica TaxID=2765360 RepID=A0AA48WBE2_9BURK|nr:hypothetical protein [Massilia antarctica]QPI48382.1 hypothetical protein IV454_22995 [Massilia antarctica]